MDVYLEYYRRDEGHNAARDYLLDQHCSGSYTLNGFYLPCVL
jgi:hypothetical protein